MKSPKPRNSSISERLVSIERGVDAWLEEHRPDALLLWEADEPDHVEDVTGHHVLHDRLLRAAKVVVAEHAPQHVERIKTLVIGKKLQATSQDKEMAALLGIPVAGKSGTAETGTPDPHAWFPAFAPADAPTITVVALASTARAVLRSAVAIAACRESDGSRERMNSG